MRRDYESALLSKQSILERMQAELEQTRARELFLANYVLQLTCEITNLEFERKQDEQSVILEPQAEVRANAKASYLEGSHG